MTGLYANPLAGTSSSCAEALQSDQPLVGVDDCKSALTKLSTFPAINESKVGSSVLHKPNPGRKQHSVIITGTPMKTKSEEAKLKKEGKMKNLNIKKRRK